MMLRDTQDRDGLISISLHVLAALKHHFVDRDQTLKRMLSSRR